jgi:hypothetical protein
MTSVAGEHELPAKITLRVAADGEIVSVGSAAKAR